MGISNVLGTEPTGTKETAATIFKLHSAKTEEYVSETEKCINLSDTTKNIKSQCYNSEVTAVTASNTMY